MYANRVSLTGFLGKDAEVRETKNDQSFTVLSLATKRSWKNRQSGDYESETTWHRCVAWGKQGDYAAGLTKGAHLQIEGEIRTREYTPAAKGRSGKTSNEAKKMITEVRVLSIAKLDRPLKPDSESDAKEPAA